jgi:RNA polymerase sigma factor (sigma-70 family)
MAAKSAIVTELTRKYYHRVYCFARQLTDPNTAEDITQEVFLRLMKIDDLPDRTISVSYLIKVAHNLIKGDHRRSRRFTAAEPALCEASKRRADAAAERDATSLPQSPAAAAVELKPGAMNRLTHNERVAIRLTVCHGLSLKEASESLGVRVSTITNWKYRGLRKLADDHQPAERETHLAAA